MRKEKHRPNKEEILSTDKITFDLLKNWFVEDTNNMNRLHMPLTKVKQIIKIIEENYELKSE